MSLCSIAVPSAGFVQCLVFSIEGRMPLVPKRLATDNPNGFSVTLVQALLFSAACLNLLKLLAWGRPPVGASNRLRYPASLFQCVLHRPDSTVLPDSLHPSGLTDSDNQALLIVGLI